MEYIIRYIDVALEDNTPSVEIVNERSNYKIKGFKNENIFKAF